MRPSHRLILSGAISGVTAALAVVFAAVSAHGEEAVATARGGPLRSPSTVVTSLPLTIPDHPLYDDRGPRGPCGGQARIETDGSLKPDKKPHGVVFAGLGTRGYREAGGAVCQPLGDHGAVSIAVDLRKAPGR